jgi:hypothetical protein
MIDAEVLRLRKLRNAALRARALAYRLDGEQGSDDSKFSKSAVTCWGIARFVSGYLSAHPNLSCQRGPSRTREWFDRLNASAAALTTGSAERRWSLLAQELGRAASELDDTRALTRSTELSDVLGRLQTNVRRLLDKPAREHRQVRTTAIGLADNWPYLTI